MKLSKIIVPLGLLGIPSFSNSLAGQPLPGSFFVIATLSVLTFWHNVLRARRDVLSGY